jgi:two-component system LytT family response regulator
MKALVIEDEILAARHLISVLKEVGNIEVIDVLDSIKSSVLWFETHPQPDLIFMDIHIADGSVFKIFEHVNITCPIIFTTAYDEYAVKAFKVNSIDYLLKPVTKEDIEKALAKLKNLSANDNIQSDIRQLIVSLKQDKSYKTHFLISVKGGKMMPLLASDIAYISIDSGMVNARTFDGKSCNLEFTLDELAAKLNPADFFRANRQFIISKSSVKEVDYWFNNRLSINLKIAVPEKILISRTRVTEFRDWFDGE